MYCIEATTPEDRLNMTKKDMGLEMIRMKRSKPVRDLFTGTVYSSMTEAAEAMGVRPCVVSRGVKNGRYEIYEDWEPYQDLALCGDVNEYVLHYIRLYYPELYESSLHVVSSHGDYMSFCEMLNVDPIITVKDGHYYDTLTNEVLIEVNKHE